MSAKHPRVLVLARSYPNPVFPNLGLWTERPTARLAELCEMRVVSPVPWCPPLPEVGPFAQYARFRRVPDADRREGIEIRHPRFVVGLGNTLYRWESHAYAAGVARTVRRLWKESPFDLIHAHFIYPDGAVARRLAERYGVPLVISEHAPWTGWLERPGVARVAVPAAHQAARILAVSNAVRETIRTYAPEAAVEVVPLGVDPEAFRPGPERLRKKDQILFVGLINYMKGIDVLLDAMAKLKADGRPGRLVLAGGSFFRNTRLQEEQLRARAEELKLGDRITFLGRRPPEEVARLMAESALLVLPSRAESFGTVLVESLSSGTPVVATRCGGPEDIVTPEVGELVPVGDSAALANALDRTLSRQDWDSNRLRAYATGRFHWDLAVDRTYQVYREVTG